MTSNRVQGGNSRDADKFVVRLPEGMRARIAVLARSQHRSMNAYIIYSMEAALKADEEANGTYVEPVIEPWEEVAPAQMIAIRPQLMEGSPCRYRGVPKIIEGIRINDSGDGVDAIINIDGVNVLVPLEDLEAY